MAQMTEPLFDQIADPLLNGLAGNLFERGADPLLATNVPPLGRCDYHERNKVEKKMYIF